jgi:hypothetical protein
MGQKVGFRIGYTKLSRLAGVSEAEAERESVGEILSAAKGLYRRK